VSWPGQHVVGRSSVDDPAVTHHYHPVRDSGDDGEIVTDQQYARTVADSFREHLQDLRLHGDVERRGRLVCNDQIGIGGDCRCDQRTLAQSARKLMRILHGAIRRIGNADPAQRVQRSLPDRSGIGQNPVTGDHFGDLLSDRAQRVERDQRILHDETGDRSTQLAPVGLPIAAHIAALDLEATGGCRGPLSSEVQQASRGHALA